MEQAGPIHQAVDAPTEMTPLVKSPKRFSLAARATCTAVSVVILAWAAYTSLTAVLLVPIFVLPSLCMFYYYSHIPSTQRGSTERLFWVYLGTAIPGIPIVAIIQGLLLIPFAALVFGSDRDFFWHEFETVKSESDIRDHAHRAARAEFTARPSYWALVFFMSFVAAAGTEELLKYAMITLGKGKKHLLNKTEYVMYGAAAGLGFATIENIGFGIAACQTETGGKLLMTVIERMVFGTTAHAIGGMLTAAGLARRDLKSAKLGHLRIVGPAIFFHGSFDFVLFGYCAWSGNIGWIHPDDVGGIAFIVVGALITLVVTGLALRQRLAKFDATSTPQR